MSAWMKLEAISHQVAIAGQVRNAQTNQGIPGVQVEITGMPPAFQAKLALLAQLYSTDWGHRKERPDRTQTRYDGCFYFLDLPNGDYTLSASLLQAGTRYGSAERRNVTVSRDLHGKIANRVIVTIDLPPTSLAGKITDRNNKALVMAKVQLEGSSEYTFSDRNGNYRLIGLEASQSPSQQRQVKVNARGYQSQATPIVLTQGQLQTMNISLAIANKSNQG
ncbi:MAG: carboxypeptidase-like regulatory domain-containing protein [Xenococcaceae cyanobacterium]